jgi:hypothetical protein
MSKFRYSDPSALKAMREKRKKKKPESELDKLAAQTPFQKGMRRNRIKQSKKHKVS